MHDDVTIRPATCDADLSDWLEASNRAQPCKPETLESVLHGFSLSDDPLVLVARAGGTPVGAAHAELEAWTPDSPCASVTVAVEPAWRRRGIGTALADRCAAWAAERGRTGLDVWFDIASADALAFWSRRGFREVGRERLSHLDLTAGPPPEGPVPDGVVLTTLAERPELEDGMYRVGLEGIADIPGEDAYDGGAFGGWRHAQLGIPGLIARCTVVALAGGEVVGFATLVRRGAQPWIAEHELTAVARAWRGRGLAWAIKCRQIALAREAGLTTLEAMNEERNAAMLAVNERLGYRPVTAWVQYRGDVPVTRRDDVVK